MHLRITATLKGPDGRVPYLSIECLPIRLITLRLIMESNKDYQRDNIILEMAICHSCYYYGCQSNLLTTST